MLGDGAYISTGLVVPHRKRPGRPLHPGEETDNAEHRKVCARVEHAFARKPHDQKTENRALTCQNTDFCNTLHSLTQALPAAGLSTPMTITVLPPTYAGMSTGACTTLPDSRPGEAVAVPMAQAPLPP